MPGINAADAAIAQLFNGFVHRWRVVDHAIAFLSENHMLKGGVLMLILWWLWFRGTDRVETERTRRHLLATLAGCVMALAVTRVLVHVLPFRQRPLHDATLHLALPFGVDANSLDGLSSFPSDHATLFFALACGLFYVSRAIGLATFAYVVAAIAMPRLYLGLHFASDIASGALIGCAAVVATNRLLANSTPTRSLAALSFSRQQLFYPLLFMVSYQIADLFEGSRAIVASAGKLLRHVAGA